MILGMGKMKVLFLMADDFPYTGACASLLNNLLDEGNLADCFDELAVATYAHHLGCEGKEWNDSTVIFRIYAAKTTTKAECIRRFADMPLKTMEVLWYKMLQKIQYLFPGNRMLGMTSKPIVKALWECGADRYDVIIPFLGEFDFSLAAMQIKRTMPNINLVIYQVDPYASNEVCSLRTRKKWIALERMLYQTADAILTTPILLEEARQRYGAEITDKMVAMEFPNVVPRSGGEKRPRDGNIRCVFTGNIYGNIRNPDYTFRLFQNLGENIRLDLYGKIPEIARAGAEAAGHRVHGPKSLDEIRSVLEEADFLVNIGNSMRNQVPSKIFEYISYGKPIINICKNRDCPTLPYMEKYPYVLNLFEEEDLLEEQREKLQQFIRAYCNRQVSGDEIEKRYRECTPQYCAEQILGTINRVCNAERTQKA